MKRLRESVEQLSTFVSTLEVKNIELENAKKLRGQEIEFKDRCDANKSRMRTCRLQYATFVASTYSRLIAGVLESPSGILAY